MELDLTDLLAQATQMLPLAHCPYSHYSVGCALLDSNGDIFVGCNVENASFGATICAERVAMTSAIAHGSHN
ncbi:MAG: cytidine deaminase, partial [Clostridia bacterium]